jgi:hypothetical protein
MNRIMTLFTELWLEGIITTEESKAIGKDEIKRFDKINLYLKSQIAEELKWRNNG